MLRPSLSALTLLGLLASAAGCKNLTETRVITAFHRSLSEHDLETLREQVSEDFETKAIKGADTFEALDLIDFPEGKIKVVKVVETKTDDKKRPIEKKVTVEVGEAKQRVVVFLEKEADSNRWVVRDEYLRREDMEKNRALSTRLEVLIGVNRVVSALRSGQRDNLGSVATPEFSKSLAGLSEEHYQQLSAKLTGGLAPQARVLPNDRLGEETAAVRVARSDGELVLEFRRGGDRWLLDDISLETRKGQGDIASVRDMSGALGTAIWFLQCYQQQNHQQLAELCRPEFYQGSLKEADLSQVPLPSQPASMQDFEVDLKDRTAAIVIRQQQELVKINLERVGERTIHDAPRYLVEEVTIYELNRQQDKRLSALFHNRRALSGFAEAVTAQDLPALLSLTTHDFKDRVWQAVTPGHFAWLPGSGLFAGEVKVLQTWFKGPLTEVLVEHGDTPVTYQLRDEDGRLRVDDVLVPASDCPQSLKATLEAMIPVANFAMALEQHDMNRLRGVASRDFTKSVWMHLDSVPEFDPTPQRYLREPLQAISVQGTGTVVVLGSHHRGARVQLVRENGRYRVEDMTLIAGKLPDERIALKRTIRTQLAEGRYASADETAGVLADGDLESLSDMLDND